MSGFPTLKYQHSYEKLNFLDAPWSVPGGQAGPAITASIPNMYDKIQMLRREHILRGHFERSGGWHPPLSPPPLFARIRGDRSRCRWGFSSPHAFWRCLQGESFPISRRNFIQELHIDVCMCRITWLFSKPLISWVYWCTKVICRSLKRKYLSHPLCDWVSILTRLE